MSHTSISNSFSLYIASLHNPLVCALHELHAIYDDPQSQSTIKQPNKRQIDAIKKIIHDGDSNVCAVFLAIINILIVFGVTQIRILVCS